MSQAHREEGNQFYRQAQNDGLPPVIQRDRLEKALVCYRRALDTGANSMEKSSALKNLGLTSMKLFNILLYMNEHISKTDYYLKEAIQSNDLALNHGQSGVQSLQWRNALYDRYMEIIDTMFNFLGNKKRKDRCHFLEEIVRKLNNQQAKSRILRETARVYFNSSVIALEAADFKSCLSLLGNCHQPLEEAKLCSTIPSNAFDMNLAFEDIKEVETSVSIHRCLAESLQAREAGDALLENSIKDSEELNMDAVYTVIDFYKKAILLTKEVEVEMEAIALSRLGNLYDCILKDQTRAKQNFMRSLQLAGSLQPRVFHHEEWYKLAALATAKYQTKFVEKEEEERAKERAPYLAELKEELDSLKKEEEKGAVPLLEFIYKSWPPKIRRNKLEKLTTDPQNQKTALKKAIVHYHPDKQDKDLHGMKWFVLAEEITKILTRKYEYFKG